MDIGSATIHSQVKYPQTGANNAGTGAVAWTITGMTNANNSIHSDRYYNTKCIANVQNITNVNYSQRLFLTNFGFGIPASATIVSVQAEFWTSANFANSALDPKSNNTELYIIKGGSITGSNVAIGLNEDVDSGSTGAGAIVSSFWRYGTNNTMWGATLTPSDVNASDFGVSFQFSISADPNNDLYFMRLALAVGYTLPESAGVLVGLIG